VISHLIFVPTGWSRYPLSPLNLEFMFGVLAAWIAKGTGSRLAPWWWAVAGVALALAMLTLMTEDNLPLARLAFAFGLALVVVGFALLERGATLAWPALLLLMGNASYSLYLIHNPLLSVTQRLFGRLDLGWLVALPLGVAVSLLAGVLYFWLVERPALGFFRRRRLMIKSLPAC
jgi:exopolysaccharide production protein ExoZ